MHDIAARKECVLEDACRSKGADGDTMSSPMLVGEAKPKPMPTSEYVTRYLGNNSQMDLADTW